MFRFDTENLPRDIIIARLNSHRRCAAAVPPRSRHNDFARLYAFTRYNTYLPTTYAHTAIEQSQIIIEMSILPLAESPVTVEFECI